MQSDPVLLWLWRRPVVTAPIGPLAWEHQCAAGVTQEKAKKDQKNNDNKKIKIYAHKIIIFAHVTNLEEIQYCG